MERYLLWAIVVLVGGLLGMAIVDLAQSTVKQNKYECRAKLVAAHSVADTASVLAKTPVCARYVP